MVKMIKLLNDLKKFPKRREEKYGKLLPIQQEVWQVILNYKLLLNLTTGYAQRLCWPNSSADGGHSVQAHVHPLFSP